MTTYIARDILIATNATAVNTSNMVCGCIERSAAVYWGTQIVEGIEIFTLFSNFLIIITFLAGVFLGIILLLLADWIYRKKECGLSPDSCTTIAKGRTDSRTTFAKGRTEAKK